MTDEIVFIRDFVAEHCDYAIGRRIPLSKILREYRAAGGTLGTNKLSRVLRTLGLVLGVASDGNTSIANMTLRSDPPAKLIAKGRYLVKEHQAISSELCTDDGWCNLRRRSTGFVLPSPVLRFLFFGNPPGLF
jgi:hypothetical protein